MISLQNIQIEVDASFLYGILAENEADPNVAEVFRQMSAIEQGHAEAFMQKKQSAHFRTSETFRKSQNIAFYWKSNRL